MKTINVTGIKPLNSLFTFLLIAVCSASLFGQSGINADKAVVNIGSFPSMGQPNGIYLKSSSTLPAQPAGAFDQSCHCWSREDGAFSMARMADDSWYMFKANNCNTNSIHGLLTGPTPSCCPADINKIRMANQLVVPFYVYPVKNTPANRNNVDESWKIDAWSDLVGYASTMGEKLIVVLDPPGPGPGTSSDPNYVRAINSLQSAGATVIGYIELGFGNRAQGPISTDITNWYQWYDIDGIFYDEANYANSSANYSDYAGHFDNVQNVIGSAGVAETGEQVVLFNPGDVTPADAWDGHEGMICTYENAASAFTTKEASLNALTSEQKKRSFILMHSLGAGDWKDKFDWFLNNGFAGFYGTSIVNSALPWNFPSTYFSSIVAEQ